MASISSPRASDIPLEPTFAQRAAAFAARLAQPEALAPLRANSMLATAIRCCCKLATFASASARVRDRRVDPVRGLVRDVGSSRARASELFNVAHTVAKVVTGNQPTFQCARE